MIVWLIALGIVAVGIGIVIGTGMFESKIDKAIADTADWLDTEATIQDAVAERLDRYISYPSFAFSYSVQGEYFSGMFFLKADEKQADELIKTLLQRKFPVQYDPDNPSAWYIENANMEGYEILQKLSADYPPDIGPYRSDGDQPIDLHLDR
ncbi:MAG: hypothetical protein ACRD3S_05090 [Terracidiphilus sp.]